MRVIDDKSVMNKALAELDKLDSYSLQIGIFGEDDSFVQMIAGVNEFGLTIRPKGQFLTIPTKAAGDRRAGEIPGLFRPKGKNILAVEDGKGGLIVMFYLKKEVTIPERSFIRSTFDEQNDKWGTTFENWLDDIISGHFGAEQVFQRLGAMMAADVQMKIRDLYDPANAPATALRKGANNPLIDTGSMRQRVTWKVMRA